MSVSFSCDNCHHQTKVKDKYAGKRVHCPKCGNSVQLPELETLQIDPQDIVSEPNPVRQVQPKSFGKVWIAVGAAALVVMGVVLGGILNSESPSPDLATHSEVEQVPEAKVASPVVAPANPISQVGTESHEAGTTHNPPVEVAAPEPPLIVEVQEPARPIPEDFEFTALTLDEPVSFMEMSEDGSFVFFSHMDANQVTVYDVHQLQKVTTIQTPAPRSILSRGGGIYVANFGKGTISYFRPDGDSWIQENEYEVTKPNIFHISASQSRNFEGQILVTCHGSGRQASYQDCHVYLLDTNKDDCKVVGKPAMASYSYDGNLVIAQGSFNLSPSGVITAYIADEFIRGDAEAYFRGGHSKTPYLYQMYPGSYWIGTNMIFGGNPIKEVHKDLGKLIVPDQTQKVVYVIELEQITAHQMNSALTKIKNRKVTFPDKYYKDDAFPGIYHRVYRHDDYFLDHSVACTHGNRLTMFLLDDKAGVVLVGETKAYVSTTLNPSTASDLNRQVPQKQNLSSKSNRPERMTLPVNGATAGNSDFNFEAIVENLPQYVAVGETLDFKLDLPASANFELMSKPEELTMNDKGVISWKPTDDQIGIHELKLRIKHLKDQEFLRPTIEVVDRELFLGVGSDYSKLNSFEPIPLNVDRYKLTDGLDGDSLLLLQGSELRRIDEKGEKVVETIELPNRYLFLEEREKYFVGYVSNTKSVEIVDKRSGKVTRTIPIEVRDRRIREISDLAIHPSKNRSYVAVSLFGDLPNDFIIEIDEARGISQETGMIGTWIEVHPDGDLAYTGYKDIYQNGVRFHINPGWRLIDIPEYGNIDMLMEWDVSSRKATQIIRNAGGNGKGIRLSADGEWIVYLSHVGLPLHSGNLTSFRTNNFEADETVYQTKDVGTCHELVFNPRLPIAAVPGSGAAVFYNQKTGKRIDKKLLITSVGMNGDEVETIHFSPDGFSLLFVCSNLEGKYIRRVNLKLSKEERNTPKPRRRVPAA